MKKIIFITLILVLISIVPIFALDFTAGYMVNPSKTLDGALTVGLDFSGNGDQKVADVYLLFNTANIRILKDAGLDLEYSDSDGNSDSDSLTLADSISLSGNYYSVGLGGDWNFYTHESGQVALQLGAGVNVHILNAALEINDDDVTVTADGLIVIPEVLGKAGVEVQLIKDVPLYLNAGVGYSMAFVTHMGGSFKVEEDGDYEEYKATVVNSPFFGGTFGYIGGHWAF